jgi:hypothetical protein
MSKTTIRGSFFIGMLFFSLLCFMLFNYMSTLQTLQHILGKEWLVYAFAFALSVVDFAGLARIFTPETSAKDESKLVYILGAVWILACLFDVIMTAYWVSLRMVENPSSVEAQNLMGASMYKTIPWIIAFGELAMRVSLVLMVGMFGDQLLHGFAKAIPALQGAANSISKPSVFQTTKPKLTQPTYRPTAPTQSTREHEYHPITMGGQR